MLVVNTQSSNLKLQLSNAMNKPFTSLYGYVPVTRIVLTNCVIRVGFGNYATLVCVLNFAKISGNKNEVKSGNSIIRRLLNLIVKCIGGIQQ